MCQIGGYLKSPSGRFIWFSQCWTPKDFEAFGVKISTDMHRDMLWSCGLHLVYGHHNDLMFESVHEATILVRNQVWTSFSLLLILFAFCFGVIESSMRFMFLQSLMLHTSLDLKWICSCFEPVGHDHTPARFFVARPSGIFSLSFVVSQITIQPDYSSLSWPFPGLHFTACRTYLPQF